MNAHPFPRAMEPGRIGSFLARNRIYMSAQTTSFGITGVPNDRHIAYLTERARGGLGLIFSEGVDVMSSHGYPDNGLRLSLADDDAIPAFAALVAAIHAEGAATFIQLTQTGHTRFWAPSCVGTSAAAPKPREMPIEELDQLKHAFVKAARRAVSAGFDGMEIHFGHGHLLHRFLSPILNIRTDGYGGSLENRLRFPMEVLSAVRAEVGREFPLGIRASTDDLGGLGPDEHVMIPALQNIVASGLADFIDLSQGGANTSDAQVPDMTHPEAPFIALTKRVVAQLPPITIMTTGRFRSLETAEKILTEGGIDFIGMTRAHTADPAIIAKSLLGATAQIRPCVACNFCAERAVWSANGLACMVNPRAGNEKKWPLLDSGLTGTGQLVVVIGGGPAGMEFARIAAQRGFSVELYEASDRLGGQMVAAGQSKARSDFNLFIAYLAGEMERLGVKVFLNSRVDPPLVRRRNPWITVVATGSEAVETQLPGLGELQHFRPDDVEKGDTGHLCLIDTEGGWRTVAAVESWMELSSGRLTIVTTGAGFVDGVSTNFVRSPLVKRISVQPITILTDHEAVEFGNGRLTARSIFSRKSCDIESIDMLRTVTNWQARNTLHTELAEFGIKAELIGDAFLPRDVLEAMRMGHQLAIDIG